MLKISTRGQYALLVMTELAENESKGYIPMKLLSHNHNISTKYLEQILIQLSKAGLVVGLRGNNGGYKLNRRPEEYTAGEILRAMEGNLSPRGNTETSVVKDAGNDGFWMDFENVINGFVDTVTLEELAEKNKPMNNYMYYI